MVDFPNNDQYEEALNNWNNYSNSLGKDLKNFTFSNFKGYYDEKQNKTGIEIVL